MELPYTVVFEPPSRSELRALLRMRGHWVAALMVTVAIGAAYLLATVARADSAVAVAVVPLSLESHPAGASVWLDGRQRGATPMQLQVDPGAHNVVLKQPRSIEQRYALDVATSGASLDAVLWRPQPVVSHLRPALPGAGLADARLLRGGDLGLSIALPPGDQLEAWQLDARSGELEQLLAPVAGHQLAFGADGRHLAYLGRDVGPSQLGVGRTGTAAWSAQPPANVVWLVTLDGAGDARVAGWRPPLEPTEMLVDVSWSPDAQRLLVMATRPLDGGQALSRAWFLDASDQQAEQILSLPSQVVPGSAAWSPDGAHVAFEAHAQQINALCLLGLDGTFRYVADLDAGTTAPLAYPAASWSDDSQRLLFVAPHQHLPGTAFDWLGATAQHALYVATLDQPTPLGLAETRLDQVAFREDGQVLGLWRATADSPLHLRLNDGSGASGQDLLELPLQVGSQYSATWDLAEAELVIASRAASGGTEFWLARLGAEDAP